MITVSALAVTLFLAESTRVPVQLLPGADTGYWAAVVLVRC